MSSSVSRRSFVKGAALGTAAVGAVAAAGASATTALADNNSSDIPESWDEEHEVVVVGSGVGLAAAVQAATDGAEVVVLEKGDHVGGLYLTAGGNATMGGGNIVQQRAGVEDTPELWYEAEMHSCEHRGVPEIIRMLCEKGVDTIQWLEDLGMVWGDLSAGLLGGDIPRGLTPAQNPGVYEGGSGTPNSGICYIQVWQNALNDLNVPIRLNERMLEVYREPNGPVVGLKVETPDGVINMKATKAVILCTGTWTDNSRMVAGWDPRLVGDDVVGDGGIPAENLLFVDSSGDGHLAATKIGAQYADMSFVSYVYVFFGSRSYWGWGEDPIDWTSNDEYIRGQGVSRNADLYRECILVNGEGKRFMNESLASEPIEEGLGEISEHPDMPYMMTYLAQPTPRNNWLIADSAIAEELAWPIEQIEDPNPRTGKMFDPACCAIADTLEELAEKMGVDPDGLVATVEAYNSVAEAGSEDEFGKEGPLVSISNPPYYGLKGTICRHTQRNGVRVNTKSQVIDGWATVEDTTVPVASIDDEPVIPHLYAAGELGDICGWRRIHNSMAHYATAARNAGEYAAQEESLS